MGIFDSIGSALGNVSGSGWLGLVGAAIGGVTSVVNANRSADAAKTVSRNSQWNAAANRELYENAIGQNLADYTTALAASMDELRAGETGALSEFQTGADRFNPWTDAGGQALSGLQDAMNMNGQEGYDRAMGQFQTGPGYQFAMDQGTKALESGAAARGNTYSGAQGKALTQYGQGMANQEWSNHLGRLAGLSTGGQQAAGSQGQFSQGMADARFKGGASRADTLLGMSGLMGNTRLAGANLFAGTNNAGTAAQNQGTSGIANAWNSGLSNLANSALFGLGRQSQG